MLAASKPFPEKRKSKKVSRTSKFSAFFETPKTELTDQPQPNVGVSVLCVHRIVDDQKEQASALCSGES